MNLKNDFWLREAQKVARLGIYIYDIKNDKWNSTEVLDEIFGIDDTYIRDFKGWLNIIHPQQREEMMGYFQQLIIKGGFFG